MLEYSFMYTPPSSIGRVTIMFKMSSHQGCMDFLIKDLPSVLIQIITDQSLIDSLVVPTYLTVYVHA